MPHIGMPELVLILVVLFLFFGASKLPQAGQALGLGLKNFKKAMNSAEDEVDVTPKKNDSLKSGETADVSSKEAEKAKG
jgi:sec-independent protein translocase protein TatA